MLYFSEFQGILHKRGLMWKGTWLGVVVRGKWDDLTSAITQWATNQWDSFSDHSHTIAIITTVVKSWVKGKQSILDSLIFTVPAFLFTVPFSRAYSAVNENGDWSLWSFLVQSGQPDYISKLGEWGRIVVPFKFISVSKLCTSFRAR